MSVIYKTLVAFLMVLLFLHARRKQTPDANNGRHKNGEKSIIIPINMARPSASELGNKGDNTHKTRGHKLSKIKTIPPISGFFRAKTTVPNITNPAPKNSAKAANSKVAIRLIYTVPAIKPTIVPARYNFPYLLLTIASSVVSSADVRVFFADSKKSSPDTNSNNLNSIGVTHDVRPIPASNSLCIVSKDRTEDRMIHTKQPTINAMPPVNGFFQA
ncbi:MAG TPA: hypothetical protein G4O15_02870 [Dehalococcoidia bacterium]|nr:hypothetical protein [Dehalococcoidia bacterium]